MDMSTLNIQSLSHEKVRDVLDEMNISAVEGKYDSEKSFGYMVFTGPGGIYRSEGNYYEIFSNALEHYKSTNESYYRLALRTLRNRANRWVIDIV